MTRTRTNSHSERRRSEREGELRRRRHHRQMSQASDRFNRVAQSFDDDLFSPPRSSPASSSSFPNLAQDSADAQSETNDGEVVHRFHIPTPLLTRWLPAQTDANLHLGDTAQRRTATRSRSDDGQQHRTDSRRDVYRNLANIQDQLDSMRTSMAGDPSDETQLQFAALQENLNQERATIEAELSHDYGIFQEATDTDIENAGQEFFASPLWNVPSTISGRRRAAMLNDVPRRHVPGVRGSTNSLALNENGEPMKHTAAFVYSIEPALTGSDVWPDIRDRTKVPAKYVPLELPGQAKVDKRSGRPRKPAIKKFDKSLIDRGIWNFDLMEDSQRRNQNITWPMNELPSEIYYLIADSLSRDDIKSMRLACKEFEHHLSCILFRTVVVPFNTEIYGMLQGLPPNGKVNVKGKGKAKAVTPDLVDFWKNSKAEDIYTGHGVDVFRSFGPRMKRFGMSFEVDEEVLANPPLKGTREDHKSYWGVYQWPYPEYKRFDQVAGLEDAADETPKMKTAFSFLNQVQELALTLDSGLGWLAGPDRSIRSRILPEQRPVFGTIHPNPDRRRQAQQCLWDYLKECSIDPTAPDLRHSTITPRKMTDQIAAILMCQDELVTKPELSMPYIDIQHLSDPAVPAQAVNKDTTAEGLGGLDTAQASTLGFPMSFDRPEVELGISSEHAFEGGLILVKEDTIDEGRLENYPIVPGDLSKLQKEWLLETEWAQRAFLSSWLIAIVDNRYTFQHVHTINFARISSRFLLSLSRNDFWTALPQLENVTLHVIPDCRDVLKDNAGFVETPRIVPHAAVWTLQKLVSDMIVVRSSIKSLSVGWVSGGEHAQGLTARNKHVMPAPILPSEWLSTGENLADRRLLEEHMIKMPHLKELTLKNCWISPHGLVHVVKEHEGLEKLILESVSLTAELVVGNGPNAQQMMAVAQQMQGPLPPAPVAAPFHHNQFFQAIQAGQFNMANIPNLPTHNNLQQQAGNNPAATTNSNWLGPHREGSWPHVLDAISPGVTLVASGSTTSPVNIPATTRSHNLTTLTLKSCGYCRLNNPRLDESAIPVPTFGGGNQYFSRRFAALSKFMLSMKGGIMAEIVQAIPQAEEQALTMGFDLSLGWPEEWSDEVEAPTFDACLSGGTGRFHGKLGVERRVVFEED